MPSGNRSEWRSLVEMLRSRAEAEPDRPSFTFLLDGEKETAQLDARELDRRARAVGAMLQSRGAVGARVLLLFPPSLEYIAALFGCMYAGAIAVPAYPPDPARFARLLPRLRGIGIDSGSSFVLTTRMVLALARSFEEAAPDLAGLTWLATDGLPPGLEDGWQDPGLGGDSLALLQYTSGSTAEPRGVQVSHANFLVNMACLQGQLRLGRDVEAVVWLPPYHDMGLIGGILLTLYNGHHVTLMAPWHFLQRPLRWLETLSRTAATHTAGPNFSLELCVRKTTPEQRAALDLSRLRLLLSGGEPVRAETLERFARAFAPAGFDSRALTPGYGLAESTLMVTTGAVDEPAAACGLDAEGLRDGWVRTEGNGAAAALRVMSCGRANPGEEVVIVDPQSRERAAPDRIGEIWVRGPSMGGGYWNRPAESAEVFGGYLAPGGEGPYLRTGDLGFLRHGELFVTGRLKDLIIIRGRNYYPQDIEYTVESASPLLRPGCGAAFGVEAEGEERLVVVQEVEDNGNLDGEAIAAAVRAAVSCEHQVAVDRLVLIQARTVPKTSSGKIQRRLTRRMIERGELAVLFDWSAPHAAPDGADGGEESAVASWIVEEVQRLAGARPGEIGLDMPLAATGLDSVHLADLVQKIEATYRLVLPLTEVPREISVRDLSRSVARQLAAAGVQVAAMGPGGDGSAVPQAAAGGDGSAVPQAAAGGDGSAVPQAAAGGDGHRPGARERFAELPEFHQIRRRLEELAEADAENPYFQVHERVAGSTTQIDGHTLINFASYNYLALCGHPAVSEAAKLAIDRFGTSASASRVASGERPVHQELERELSELLGTEDCLVFVSGNLTNVTTLGHLVGPGDLVVHDALAHDSILRGVALSGASRRTFPHNDWRALDRLLEAVRDQYKRALVVIEGVYSMDGDVPDLPRFVEVKERHGAFLMVDEAHSVGVLGPRGRGIAEHFGTDPARVEIWMGTLSKAFASCGGYVAGSRRLVEYLKYSAPGFVFSVGLPPPSAAAALAAIRLMRAEPERVARLQARARFFLELARGYGLDTGGSDGSPVVPVILGSSHAAIEASNRLRQRGINVQPIVYPAVEEGSARLRFFICSDHSEEQLRAAAAAVAEVVAELHAKERFTARPQAPAEAQVETR